MKLQDIRARCDVEGGHWIWTGATSAGGPNVWAPDYTNGGKMVNQRGPRAAWHLKTKAPIPAGHRVFITCGESMCVNPDHVECIPVKQWGQRVRETGAWKGDLRLIARNRKINRSRTPMTPEKMAAILEAPAEKGHRQLGRELGLHHMAVARVRRGEFKSLAPVGSVFAGLMAANDKERTAA